MHVSLENDTISVKTGCSLEYFSLVILVYRPLFGGDLVTDIRITIFKNNTMIDTITHFDQIIITQMTLFHSDLLNIVMISLTQL